MRPHVNEFYRICAEMLTAPEPIVEVGAFQVPGQEAISDLRPFFPGKAYLGTDMRPGPGVERIEDIHDLSFPDGEVGTFLLADTLEHVWNPHQAFSEIHRCLREDGVAIFSSVMLFPIHAHPEDYWRYTPETLRRLSAEFSQAAIFYAGEAIFPHTVCGVVAKSGFDGALLRPLSERLASSDALMPYPFDPYARRLIRHLAQQILPDSSRLPAAPSRDGSDSAGGFDKPLSVKGWVLTSGQWVRGWVHIAGGTAIELRAGGRTVHRDDRFGHRDADAEPTDPARGDDPFRFSYQVELSGIGDVAGPLQLVVIGEDERETTVAESAPGLLVGSVKPPSGFSLYSLDERATGSKGQAGRELVDSIRARGEKVVVDLGCGFRKRGTIGIDSRLEGTSADLQCNLGFELIPLDDEVADAVYCQDFLEHLPKGVYSERRGEMTYPIVQLFNEVWRILRPGGVFTSRTPCYPNVEIHQDPTHLSVWTLKSMDYFCGKYPIAQGYGVEARFELVENRMDRFYLYAELRKPLREDPGEDQVSTAGEGA